MFDRLKNKLLFKTSSLPNLSRKSADKNEIIKQGILLKQGKINKKVFFFCFINFFFSGEKDILN